MRKFYLILVSLIFSLLFFFGVSAKELYYQSGISYFPNGKETFQIYAIEKNKWIIEIAGKEYSAGEKLLQLKLSPTGSSYVFARQEEEVQRVVTHFGEDEFTFKKISHIILRKDDYAYIGFDGKNDLLIKNGKILEKFSKIKNLSLDSNGNVIASVRFEGRNRSYREETGINLEFEKVGGLYTSSNSQRTIQIVQNKEKWYYSENNNFIHETGFDLIMDIKFSGNEETFFSTIKKGNEWFLVDARGKEISDPSIYIPDMKVSEKGDQVAYVSFPKEGERNLLYINDTVIEKAFKIDILGWNEDGILGYLIQDEKGKKKYLEYK